MAISSGSVPGLPADQEPPSYEVLAALVVSLCGELARAQERITGLEDRPRTTSRNSSMPPSGGGLAKPPPRSRSLRNKTGRRPGGQDGPPGTTLAQVAKPDRGVRHEPGSCSGCGAGLAGRPVTGIERRQVADLPAVTVKVTGHQLIERECGCGHRTRGAAPKGGQAPCSTGRGSRRSSSTSTPGSSCPESAPRRRWLSCSASRCRPGRSRASLLVLPGSWTGSWSGSAGTSPPPATSRASMRPGSGLRAGCTGCTAPAPANTPC